MGSLEAEVLKFLWSQDHAATPGEVLEGLGSGLAYTTVMTILTRLWSKQLVFRDRDGRAYAYRPALSEAEFAARKMADALSHVVDRKATLSRFVGGLTKKDAAALRKLLDRP